MSYADFLERKRPQGIGGARELGDLHPKLFPHQQWVTRWASARPTAAVFLDAGMGKTAIQLEWARHAADTALILAPLSVARQTVREGAKFDMDVRYVRSQDQVTGPGLWITNYEMESAFDPRAFGAVVGDESGILKNHTGATRNTLIDRWAKVPHVLACSATPAPNDITELTNHAEFLRTMSRVEMLAAFFVHDDEGWRPKRHAVGPMYRWMASWACAATKPSDLGEFDDTPYLLPPLTIHGELVEVTDAPEGQLFATGLGGVTGRSRTRKQTLSGRLARSAELLDHDRPAIAWCGLNEEADKLTRDVKGAENLHGTLPAERKAEIIEAFQDGEIRVLVSKPSIAGFGLNFQHASQQVFCGIGDSYEMYYQAIRRSWRFGQHEPVDVHIVVSTLEQEIVRNVQRKEREAAEMTAELIKALREAT